MSGDREYVDGLVDGAVKGRGAGLNPGNRFEGVRLHVLGDHLDVGRGLGGVERGVGEEGAGDGCGDVCGGGGGESGRQVRTEVFTDHSRTVINRVTSPDIPFSWTLNPYRGCEHGCVYCYARPSHEELGFSCGLDFETKIVAKMDAPRLLERRLGRRSWAGEPIAMSGVTDPYQPVESRLRITRRCLSVMAECRQPVGVITKSHMVTRDVDLLGELAGHGAGSVAVSVTTLDVGLSGKMEPRASSPGDRLRAISCLAGAGVPVTVMVSPVVPGLNDRELPAILEAARDAGATGASYVLLRLPYQLKGLFLEWLGRVYPERLRRVEGLIRGTRGGRLYDSRRGVRMLGEGAVVDQIARVFGVFSRRYGLDGGGVGLSGAAFRRPGDVGGGLFG